MINNPEWLQPEERTYFHQLSPECISQLAEVYTKLSSGNMDIHTSLKMYEKILINEINDPQFLSFAIENLNELSSYIAKGKLNIRIHRNDVDELWFDVDEASHGN